MASSAQRSAYLFGRFAVSVAVLGGQAVLGVGGEVDLLGAPVFGSLLDAVIDRGCRSVVLDLSEMDFMGAAGLWVIGVSANRLASMGGSLTVRSPSPTIRRILDINGLAGRVRVEPPVTSAGVDTEQDRRDRPVRAGRGGPTSDVPVPVAVPPEDGVVGRALQLVVVLTRAAIGGADSVSVSLRRHGQLVTVASSDETASSLDARQYAFGEGPCVDASASGRWLQTGSLESETRWPSFTPKARALGISAVLSTPLLAEQQPVGALNVYSRRVATFPLKDQELAAVFATEVSTLLTGAGAVGSVHEGAIRLQNVLLA